MMLNPLYIWLMGAVILLGLSIIVVGAWALTQACGEAEKRRKELKRRRALTLDHLRGTVKLILEEKSLTNDERVRELTMAINEAGYSLRRQP